ncbi:hypothetical protein SAMN05216548_10710 [Faunimonas pinastri]|uniref:Uncharacterized protein n=1 Tax=Faunimonas pinastri TaxID=1855383 RepID=A0A1H9I7P3_9HYPH|nr:hypothetical protein [Faunimonas pinastri]SEQ70577.1 hypothetical protein SAMN05216548_10710 [Faunimonas pinastri]
MEGHDPSAWFEYLPPWAQAASNFAVLLVAVGAGAFGYLRKGGAHREGSAESSVAVVTGGALADRMSMQDLAGAIREQTGAIRDQTGVMREQTSAVKRHADIIEERADQDEEERRIEAAVERRLGEELQRRGHRRDERGRFRSHEDED